MSPWLSSELCSSKLLVIDFLVPVRNPCWLPSGHRPYTIGKLWNGDFHQPACPCTSQPTWWKLGLLFSMQSMSVYSVSEIKKQCLINLLKVCYRLKWNSGKHSGGDAWRQGKYFLTGEPYGLYQHNRFQARHERIDRLLQGPGFHGSAVVCVWHGWLWRGFSGAISEEELDKASLRLRPCPNISQHWHLLPPTFTLVANCIHTRCQLMKLSGMNGASLALWPCIRSALECCARADFSELIWPLFNINFFLGCSLM